MPLIFCGLVEAKRGPALKVAMISGEIKIIAPNTPEKMGYIEVWNRETKEILWQKKAYTVFINPMMEPDAQWKFITWIESTGDGNVLILDEDKKQHIVVPPKEIAEILKENYLLRKSAKNEKWARTSVEGNEDAIREAKQALEEWGQDPEKYESAGKLYDYEIKLSESENFISVEFCPTGVDESFLSFLIKMAKSDFRILSIGKLVWENYRDPFTFNRIKAH